MKLAEYSQESKKRGILTGPLKPQPLKAGVTGLKPPPLRRSDLENGVCQQHSCFAMNYRLGWESPKP